MNIKSLWNAVELAMISATGQHLDLPWKILVNLSKPVHVDIVEEETRRAISQFPELTRKILAGELVMA